MNGGVFSTRHSLCLLVVSKQGVKETTEKESIMQAIIFSILAIVIVVGGLWYHDVRPPPKEQARERKRNHSAIKDGTADQSKEQLVGVHITKR
jgi:hypothetical protein